MYRLDYLSSGAAVKDFTGRDFLCQHMKTAREQAAIFAIKGAEAVLITRIGKSGVLKATLVARPDGTFARPPGSKAANEREDCKAGTGETCFCSPCRAARRLI